MSNLKNSNYILQRRINSGYDPQMIVNILQQAHTLQRNPRPIPNGNKSELNVVR